VPAVGSKLVAEGHVCKALDEVSCKTFLSGETKTGLRTPQWASPATKNDSEFLKKQRSVVVMRRYFVADGLVRTVPAFEWHARSGLKRQDGV